MRVHTISLAMLATLAACGTQIGTETGSGCEVASQTTVTDLTSTPDGFTLSVQEGLDLVVGTFDGTFTYATGGTDDLILTITRAGDPVVERLQETPAQGGIEPALATLCEDRIRVPATVTVTMGTALDESYVTSVHLMPDGTAKLSATQAFADMVGDLAPGAFDPTQMAQTEQVIDAARDDLGWRGTVGFRGESEPSGTGPDASVSLTIDEVGAFELPVAGDTDQ